MYAMHGALQWMIAGDVVRYAPLVGRLGFLAATFGATMLAIDAAAGMPWWWTLVEGPGIVLLGCFIIILHRMSGLENIGR